MYQRPSFGRVGSTPHTSTLRYPYASSNNGMPQVFGTSPTAERHPRTLATSTSDPATIGQEVRPLPTICIRRLPRSIGNEALHSLLIFAVDLIDVEFVSSPHPEDRNYATAVARFHSPQGAFEAQEKLNGKPNATKEANMVVEILSDGVDGLMGGRRNTVDGISPRQQSSSASSSGSSLSGPPGRQSSRYGNTFQSTDKISPPLATSKPAGSGDFPVLEHNGHFKNLFSPQSPLANGYDDRHRVSGKSMINDDIADDETGELLKDPVAYAKNGHHPMVRRTTHPDLPLSRFGSLSLTTSNGSGSSMASPPSTSLTSPRSNSNAVQSPSTAVSPTAMSSMSPNGSFTMNYPRHNYPPVNPADQNPPCNTLYVGNLPIDTSEDELKAMFSKQRGYKRLCFRTKQNGPMCFVEFEDVSFATKALNELYGHPLHNSVKGGIRLSFSKNPLGVRTGQGNGMGPMGPTAPMTPGAMSPGFGNGMAAGSTYTSVSGPPPGLGAPPGLMSSGGYRSPPIANGVDSMFSNPFAMANHEYGGAINPQTMSGGVPAGFNGATFGKDMRAATGFSDYMLGR